MDEKIYCSGTDPMIAALLTRDNGFNNPMLLLWAEIFGNGNGFGRGGYSPEIESLRNQIADNKNSSDLMQFLDSHNSLLMDLGNRTNTSVDFVRQGICQISAAIERFAGDNIPMVGEEISYIAGELGIMMWPMAKNLLCEDCRTKTTNILKLWKRI